MPGVTRLMGCQGCGVPGDAATRIWAAPVQQRGDLGAGAGHAAADEAVKRCARHGRRWGCR